MKLKDFCANVVHVLSNDGFKYKPSRFGKSSTGNKAWNMTAFSDSKITSWQSYNGEDIAEKAALVSTHYPFIKSDLASAMERIWWLDEVKYSDINIIAYYCFLCIKDLFSKEVNESCLEAIVSSFNFKYYESSNVTRFSCKTMGGLWAVWFQSGNIKCENKPFEIYAKIKGTQVFRGSNQLLLKDVIMSQDA